MARTTHPMRDGFCVTCGETDEWLAETGEVMVPAPTAAAMLDCSTVHRVHDQWCIVCGAHRDRLAAHGEPMEPARDLQLLPTGTPVRLARGRLTHLIAGTANGHDGRVYTATYCGSSFQAGDHAHDETKPMCKACAQHA